MEGKKKTMCEIAGLSSMKAINQWHIFLILSVCPYKMEFSEANSWLDQHSSGQIRYGFLQ